MNTHAGHDRPTLPAHVHNAPGQAPSGTDDRHAGHSAEDLRSRFWIALALTLPTVAWGHMLPVTLGFAPPSFPGARFIPGFFGTATFVAGGGPFLRGALRELRARAPGMMTLIALALLVAFLFSAAVLLGLPGMPLWEELATLITIMLLGHWVEMRSLSQARGALAELGRLLPPMAERIASRDGAEVLESVAAEALVPGDLVLVRPGARIPADVVVAEGDSEADESMLTGESRPVPKGPGAKGFAGTVNLTGALRARVTEVGPGSMLGGIVRLVAEAQRSKSRAEILADRAARWLTGGAIAAGLATLTIWLAKGATLAFSIERMAAVLVIACPHALGLAIPLVIAISTTLGARSGLLVRDRRGLEEARHVRRVIFDKTGTLTRGEHQVVAIRTAPGVRDDDALARAAAVEADAEHPIGRAIVRTAAARGLPPRTATRFQAMPGVGAQGLVDGSLAAVGGPALLHDLGLTLAPEWLAWREARAGRGEAVTYLVADGGVQAAFALADAVRPESREAVDALRSLGVEVALLTGDDRVVAENVAHELGIATVFAQVLPAEKAGKVREYQRGGVRVAMVGDGVNDAPALATADLGIAIGAGTDIAMEAGDVILIRSDPRDVARMIRLSRASYRKMVQNLWWASGYNVVAVPVAAGALAGLGFIPSPAFGAVLMSLSTVVVAVNAQLLRRARL